MKYEIVELPNRVRACRAVDVDDETVIPPSIDSRDLPARHAAIQRYARSIAHNEVPRHRCGDDVMIGALVEKLRSLSRHQCIRFHSGVFEDWRSALELIQRHPFLRKRYKIQLLSWNGMIEIGQRVTPKRTLYREAGI